MAQTGNGSKGPAPKLPGEREFKDMIKKVKFKYYDILTMYYGSKARETKGQDSVKHMQYKIKYWHYFNRGVELMK